jgi:hypothetical protein
MVKSHPLHNGPGHQHINRIYPWEKITEEDTTYDYGDSYAGNLNWSSTWSHHHIIERSPHLCGFRRGGSEGGISNPYAGGTKCTKEKIVTVSWIYGVITCKTLNTAKSDGFDVSKRRTPFV